MADTGVRGFAGFTAVGDGPFSRLAREQYAALAVMRARMFVNGLRSNEGVFELGARAVAYVTYGFMGLGLGVGAGAAAYSIVSRQAWQYLAIELWIVCCIWQALSIALASFQEQFDLTGLLRFPVNFPSFFLLHLIFGLIDVSTIIGSLAVLGILTGITLARPDLLGWTAPGLAGFAAFNILLVRAVLAWIDRWLARRRSREIVSALFLLAVLALQLLNPALRQENEENAADHAARFGAASRMATLVRPWMKAADTAQAWLPPGLTSVTLQHGDEHESATAIVSLGLTGLYLLGAGALLAVRLRAEYRGENLGDAPSRKRSEIREGGWLIGGAGPISAVIEKELRTLLRSMPQLYALGVPMFMVFIIGGLFLGGASESNHRFHLALPICVAYGLLGFIQLIYNNLGAEGNGIQVLLLSPTPIRTVLLAKNLFHALLFSLVALVAGILASLRLGRPSAVAVATTMAWLAFALPANLAAGNVLSLAMPYRVNLGRIGRQSGSQANALLSMLIQTTVLGVGAGAISLCAIFGKLWLTVPVLSALAGVAVLTWLKVLRNADSMAYRRRDTLIARLARMD
jgi:ABC-2 type transport system permease protein